MAEIAVCFLLDQLKPFLLEEASLLSGVGEEVEHIKDELEQMKSFLRVADAKEKTDPQLRILVKQLCDVAYDTEDALDEFILRLAHPQGDGFYGFLRKISCSIKNLKARHRMASEIQRIKSRVDNIFKSSERFRNVEQGSSSAVISYTWSDGRGDALLIEEAELVGIEKPKQKLISWLLDGDSQLKVVSVLGMGGLGKTTLVKKVFDDKQVKKQFQSHAWITVSQSFHIVKLLRDLIEQLYGEIKQALPRRMETMNEDKLKAVLKEFLQERRYVVVLDDIWSIHAWDAIKYALPNSNCGSRVLLTTRILDVASASRFESQGYMYKMKALSDDESWTLFCNKTFEDKCCPQHLKGFSQNILRKCEGLPLAIVAIGGVLALKDKSRIDEWEMIRHDLSVEPEGTDKLERMKKILSLSYHDLPYYLKLCFLYLNIFPEDYEFEKIRVIRLWTAEGFVQDDGRKLAGEIAEGYFNELLNRSLIQVAETTFDGRPKTCRIHDLLRETILSKSREQNMLTLPGGQYARWPKKVRHLALHNFLEDVQESDCCVPHHSLLMCRKVDSRCKSTLHAFLADVKESKRFRPLRCLLMFRKPDSSCNSSVFSLLIGGCKLLKVLDLSFAPLEAFPDEVFQLLHLRYLSMRETKVKAIPKSIGKLRNLETFDLRGTKVADLPVEIGKLQKLRYLLVYRNKFFEVGCKAPEEIGNLSSLLKLGTIEANQSNGNTIMGDIGKLTQLRTLHITELRREDGMALCSSLEKLSNLRSFSVRSIPTKEDDILEIIDLNSLSSGPPFLQKLYLKGRLEKLPHWISSLHSLVRVWLSWSGLKDDPLQCLQDLPNLLHLEFYSAYNGDKLCFKAGGFRKLKTLSLWDLEELRWVRVEGGAMPFLEKLTIWNCKLAEVPSGIEHLTNLGSLRLVDLPDSLSETLSNKDQEGGDYWKIAHIPVVVIGYWKDGCLVGDYL